MSGLFKTNENGSITIKCSHYIKSNNGAVCDSLYPCEKIKVIQTYELSKSINAWCMYGILNFDWIDVLKIGNKKIERLANIRLGSKKESIV